MDYLCVGAHPRGATVKHAESAARTRAANAYAPRQLLPDLTAVTGQPRWPPWSRSCHRRWEDSGRM